MVDKSQIGGKTVGMYIMEGGLRGRIFLRHPENIVWKIHLNAYKIDFPGHGLLKIIYVDEKGEPCGETTQYEENLQYLSGIFDDREYLPKTVSK